MLNPDFLFYIFPKHTPLATQVYLVTFLVQVISSPIPASVPCFFVKPIMWVNHCLFFPPALIQSLQVPLVTLMSEIAQLANTTYFNFTDLSEGIQDTIEHMVRATQQVRLVLFTWFPCDSLYAPCIGVSPRLFADTWLETRTLASVCGDWCSTKLHALLRRSISNYHYLQSDWRDQGRSKLCFLCLYKGRFTPTRTGCCVLIYPSTQRLTDSIFRLKKHVEWAMLSQCSCQLLVFWFESYKCKCKRDLHTLTYHNVCIGICKSLIGK